MKLISRKNSWNWFDGKIPPIIILSSFVFNFILFCIYLFTSFFAFCLHSNNSRNMISIHNNNSRFVTLLNCFYFILFHSILYLFLMQLFVYKYICWHFDICSTTKKNFCLQQHPVYQQPHQHHSANELYEMYDEYATGTKYSYKVMKLIWQKNSVFGGNGNSIFFV